MKKLFAGLSILALTVLLMAGCCNEATRSEGTTSDEEQTAEETAEYATPEQMLTARNILSLAQRIEQYIMDNSDVGSPKTSDIHELDQILRALDINTDSSIFIDGWGDALVYEPDMTMGSKDYEIRGLGSDGRPGPEPEIAGIVGETEEDYIWRDGHWVQRHEGPAIR